MIVFKSVTKQAFSAVGKLYVTEIQHEIRGNEIVPVDLPLIVDGAENSPAKKDRNYGLNAYLK